MRVWLSDLVWSIAIIISQADDVTSNLFTPTSFYNVVLYAWENPFEMQPRIG